MAVLPWKLEKDLCRCCHAEGDFHSLSDPGLNSGQPELYLDMLKIDLNLELYPIEGMLYAMTFTICDTCIDRLREASKFRNQVLLCEKQFHEIVSQYLDSFKPEVKEEPLTVEIVKEEKIDSDHEFDVKFDDSEDEEEPLLKKILIGYPNKQKGKNAKAKTKGKKPVKKKVTPKKNQDGSEVGDESKDSGDEIAQGDEMEVGDEPPKKKKGEVRRGPKFVLKQTDYRQDGDTLVCTHCDKKYDKLFSLRYHLKSKHYKISRYFCEYCNEGFLTQAPLTQHKLSQHDLDERFKCKACSAAFNTSVQLRKHVNNYHMLGQKYKCQFCDYESFSFEGLYKHKFKHKTVKDFHCKFCRKSFLRKATLDLHERIHTGDRRKVCQVCGQAFVQKASLNYHMTKYHPEVNF